MLVYGDASRWCDPRVMLARVTGNLRDIAALPPGIVRHAALVSLLVEAGELAQGTADAEFLARGGVDARAATADASMLLLSRIAGAVRESWYSGFALAGPPSFGDAAAALATLPLPDVIEARRAEGFSIYGLYPECFVTAAAGLPRGVPVRVIGLRSIGAPLGAIVAAEVGDVAPATLRPVGHPFGRELCVAETLAVDLLAEPDARFAVVDEGPGLSGSSFGAVSDFLEDRGVEPGRVHVLPGHAGGPGTKASPRHRARWDRTRQIHVAEFDDVVLRASRPEQRLEGWVADLIGPVEGLPEEISGGGWRRLSYAGELDWPPVHAAGERRKFLVRAEGTRWLLRFAGLGPNNARKEERARALASAGLAPPVAGYRHGFLVERWMENTQPLALSGVERSGTIGHVGRYLRFRTERFPAEAESGASLATLLEMAQRNAGLALGVEAARVLNRWKPALPRLERGVRRIETDNRLHAWEWIMAPDGRLLKTDALDHHAGHDLIGCQDLAWDLAGATVELNLSSAEGRALRQAAGGGADPELVVLLRLCYTAFQLGYYSVAAEAANGWPEEQARLCGAARRYVRSLRFALETSGGNN